MTPRTYQDFLQDILDSIDNVESFTREMDFDRFIDDKKTYLAVTRALEIIGEATKNIPGAVRDRYPEIPWRKMAGLRDRLAHAYFGTDPEILWELIKKDLPPLKPLVKKVMSQIR